MTYHAWGIGFGIAVGGIAVGGFGVGFGIAVGGIAVGGIAGVESSVGIGILFHMHTS